MADEITREQQTEAEQKEALKKLQALLANMQSEGNPSPLLALLQLFLNLFTSPDPDMEDFDDTRTAEEEQAATREYDGRIAAEREQYRDYIQPQRFIPQSIDDVRGLDELRAKYGQGLKAIVPVRGNVRIASDFGDRLHPTLHVHKHHDGLDITPVPRGTNLPIIAPMPGKIVEIRWRGGYGLTMDMVDIDGVRHRFAHLSAVGAKVGDLVEQGEDIATMGSTGRSTGPHLHYEQMGAGNVRRAPLIAGRVWHEGEQFTAESRMAGKYTPAAETHDHTDHETTAPANPEDVKKQKPAAEKSVAEKKPATKVVADTEAPQEPKEKPAVKKDAAAHHLSLAALPSEVMHAAKAAGDHVNHAAAEAAGNVAKTAQTVFASASTMLGGFMKPRART